MSQALTGQTDYYARHQRRQSSMSQSSLPDQLKNSIAAAYNPSRSAVLLPATIYGQIHADNALPSTAYTNGQNSNIPFPQLDGPNDTTHTGEDPDDFYRNYQSQFSTSLGGPLRQGAIRTTDIEHTGQVRNVSKSSFRSTSTDTKGIAAGRRPSISTNDNSRTPTALPGLRGRKSSVKNLVDHINASSVEEAPPLPVNHISRPTSRNVSPIIPSGANSQQYSASKKPSAKEFSRQLQSNNGLVASQTRHNGLGVSMNTPHISEIQAHRKPLFGEVMTSSPSTVNLGYGIQDWRLRRGSEGSPVTTPNFVFPPDPNRPLPIVTEQTQPDVSQNSMLGSPLNRTPRPGHRRVNSASPSITTVGSTSLNTRGISETEHTPSRHHFVQSPISRIPIIRRRDSATTGADLQSAAPLAPSSAEQSSALGGSPTTPKRSSPRRRQKTPTHIQSPSRRNKPAALSQDQKSPLLRANIIAPPPKVSPPLRSSRPRLPVSSASTAASRARMAEKFNAMQKMHNEKRSTSRRIAKPPELTDIDLKARRLRITQALSRSLEGHDLRGNFDTFSRRDFSSSRTASPATSERSQWTDPGDMRTTIPAVVIDGTNTQSGESDNLQTPAESISLEDRHYTQNALHAIERLEPVSNNADSPTLGFEESDFPGKPSPLQTDFLHTDYAPGPSSALTDITVQTEGTTIDPEPQVDINKAARGGQSILNQITDMRSQSHNSLRLTSSWEDGSDRGDSESVHLILRDTTYLDDSEAIRTGYRTAPNDALPPVPVVDRSGRDSWTSSFEEFENDDRDHDHYLTRLESSSPATREEESERIVAASSSYLSDHDQTNGEAARTTIASDTYTIVNIVLQRHSLNGIVDQQFVDDVYARVLKDSPYDTEGTLNTGRVEQFCIEEIRKRDTQHHEVTSKDKLHGSDASREEPSSMTKAFVRSEKAPSDMDEIQQPELPQPPFKSHKYKSSLDSVEDWADTSPSVSDWMRFAHGDGDSKGAADEVVTPVDTISSDITLTSQSFVRTPTLANGEDTSSQTEEDDDLYGGSVRQSSAKVKPNSPLSKVDSTEPVPFGSALVEPPQVPRRITSLSVMGRPPPPVPPSAASGTATPAKLSTEEVENPEQRRLKRRRHVVKELVDTEFTYEKDLRVLCDIYKQTASAALSDDDIKVLFGNIEQIQVFSRDFLMLLKSVAKPLYVMERPDRRKDKVIEDDSLRPNSSSSTLASRTPEIDAPSSEKDRETCIGQAFESSLADMERIYAEYIRNRHAANQKLLTVQKLSSAREWLKECRDNSSDITNAWNLDALLVKPVQRITKYPLLLKELVEATPDDHPDVSYLRRALYEVTEVNVRINDVKKHTELVDQVLNRKRKDSDVRVGLSKAFGRKAEKLKQHVGIAEMYEDNEYNDVRIQYDNNIVQLMVVNNDCGSYGRAVRRWVTRMVEIASAAEAWVDVGHSHHQEAESKLRQFAMVTRGISTIALPAHIEQLEAKVLTPMQQAVDYMNRFKNDPKGLLQKRDKRLIDYAQAKNRKEKGEKIDKKMIDRMEQWEALNSEAKERLRKLIKATATLVQACQSNLIQLQMSWLSLVKTKLSAAMAISLNHLNIEDITRDWQMDFDYREASALYLSICNGALLTEAVNMVSFQTPSTTANGEDSPREASFSTKRSISLHSDGSHVQIPEAFPRTSAQHSRHAFDNPNDRSQLYGSGFSRSRERAASAASTTFGRTPEPSVRSGFLPKHSSVSAGFAGSGLGRSEEGLSTAPLLSIDTPSPLIGSLQLEPTNNRPPSSSTFFSATAEAPIRAHHLSTGSSVFSSAMPMSDSPTVETHSNPSDREPDILFTAASVYEFNIDRSRREAGFPYLTYVTGEIFDVIGERGELWLARNQDDPNRQIGWIWNKHFAKLAA